MKKLLAHIMLTAIIVMTGVSASASEITPINEINISPVNFDGKEVRLKGVAKDFTRIPLMYLKSYVLEDETGEITILTEAEFPEMNKEINIRVRVESIAIIQGESLGLTVVELERY